MAKHYMDVKLAQAFGVHIALLLEHLAYWIHKNLANKKHIYDGNCWTYNSMNAFCSQFPYWTARQVERIINNAEKEGLILKGNYNKSKYDRTTWYALTEKALVYFDLFDDPKLIEPLNLRISPNGEMERTKRLNGFCQTVEPIPDIKPSNRKDIKNTIVDFKKSTGCGNEQVFEFEEFEKPDYETEQALESNEANSPLSPEAEDTKPDYSKNQSKINTIKPKSNHNIKKEYKEDPLFMAFYSAYPNKQKPRVAYKAFLRLEPNFEFVKQIINDVKTRMENNWRGRDKSKIPFPATYLNSFEWEGEIFLPASDSHYKPKSSARYDDHDTSWINMEAL